MLSLKSLVIDRTRVKGHFGKAAKSRLKVSAQVDFDFEASMSPTSILGTRGGGSPYDLHPDGKRVAATPASEDQNIIG